MFIPRYDNTIECLSVHPTDVFAPKHSQNMASIITFGMIASQFSYRAERSVHTESEPHQSLTCVQITMALEATYLTSTACTKISILLFYRRLGVGTVTNRFLYSVYAAIAFVLAYYITFTVNLFVGCRPINAFWNQADLVWLAENDGKYSCFDEATNMIAAAVISVLQDFIACFMPTILFWKLRIRRQQKFALCAIFGVGFL